MAENNRKTAKKRRGPGRPFQPGQSGNPGGRPKMDPQARELARAYTADAIETLHGIMKDKKAGASARVAAANAILDRAWGKPAQAMEITGVEGGPIETREVSDIDLARRVAYMLETVLKRKPEQAEH